MPRNKKDGNSNPEKVIISPQETEILYSVKRQKKRKGQTRRGDKRGETKHCGNKH